MMRIFLHYVLPLLGPLALYLIWASVANHRARGGKDGGPADRWLWALAAGFVLMVAGLVYTALTSGHEAGGVYQSPRYEDGHVVPGKFTDPPE